MPAPAFPKGIVSPSIMAYIMTPKYVEGIASLSSGKAFWTNGDLLITINDGKLVIIWG